MKFEMKEEIGFKTELEYGELHVSSDTQFGYRPYQLLVSSVAVCSGGVLRKILDKMRISYDDIGINASVTRNPQEADRIERIELHLKIKLSSVSGSTLSAKKMDRAMELTRKNCSMVRSIEDSIEVIETYEIIE